MCVKVCLKPLASRAKKLCRQNSGLFRPEFLFRAFLVLKEIPTITQGKCIIYFCSVLDNGIRALQGLASSIFYYEKFFYFILVPDSGIRDVQSLANDILYHKEFFTAL